LATKAVPNYDRRVTINQTAISSMKSSYEPMSCGDLTSYMPETGAHDDIGPLPRFAALYLMTMDLNAKANMLANGGCGGSYQIHYRDKAKNMPVTLDDYPFMTILGNPGDTYNPKTGKYESFPTVTNGLDTLTPDDAHQPSIAYLPYLISGDYFFLEELLFWTNWNLLYTNPGYRDNEKGLLRSLQERGQAWDLRTLSQAAFITPDDHPQKAGLLAKLNNNIDYYTKKYADTVKTNRLGYIDDGYSLAYAPYGIAPWQDDFFTYSIGFLVDLGFTQAKNLLLFKSRFVVGRMTDAEFCWLHASAYSLQVGKSDSAKYQTFGEMYRANFPDATACTGLVMDGYPDSPTSYGSNMQPGLVAAVDYAAPGAAKAWTKYETRSPKQDYTSSPQWAIVPRSTATQGVMMQHDRRIGHPDFFIRNGMISYSNQSGNQLKLEVFSVSGRRILTLPLTAASGLIAINRVIKKAALSPGAYLLSVKFESGSVYSNVLTSRYIMK